MSATQFAHSGPTAGVQMIPGLVTPGRPGRLHMVWLDVDATHPATAVIYDAFAAASGTVLARVSAQATWSNGMALDVLFQFGVFAVVVGTGSDLEVSFE